MRKLIIVLLLAPALLFAKTPVPNTTTFSLLDVCAEIYGTFDAGMNLNQCFIDAIGTFDPNYMGSKNSLLNFRNYVQNQQKQVIRITLHIHNNGSNSCSIYATSDHVVEVPIMVSAGLNTYDTSLGGWIQFYPGGLSISNQTSQTNTFYSEQTPSVYYVIITPSSSTSYNYIWFATEFY